MGLVDKSGRVSLVGGGLIEEGEGGGYGGVFSHQAHMKLSLGVKSGKGVN